MLIVGLGNIGDKYKINRHNVGFLFIDYITAHYKASDFKNKFNSLFTTLNLGSKKIFLQKPTTFMNLSGIAVAEITSFYKIPVEDVIVIQDDIDLQFGDIRYKTSSSDGGQNGIKSIHAKLGKNIHRIKIGIGRPSNHKQDISSYVLSNFSEIELIDLDILFTKIAESFELLINKEFNNFIQTVKQKHN